MSTIQVQCRLDHVMKVRPGAIQAWVDDPTNRRGRYQWRCAVCDKVVEKLANAKILGMLEDAGVVLDQPHPEIKSMPDAPPLTLDDLIDFHRELEAL